LLEVFRRVGSSTSSSEVTTTGRLRGRASIGFEGWRDLRDLWVVLDELLASVRTGVVIPVLLVLLDGLGTSSSRVVDEESD
jgi:hypothetical protein